MIGHFMANIFVVTMQKLTMNFCISCDCYITKGTFAMSINQRLLPTPRICLLSFWFVSYFIYMHHTQMYLTMRWQNRLKLEVKVGRFPMKLELLGTPKLL